MFNSTARLESISPQILAMAPETDIEDWTMPNTGVMVINVPALRGYVKSLHCFILAVHVKHAIAIIAFYIRPVEAGETWRLR
jgi:hypothetical protein